MTHHRFVFALLMAVAPAALSAQPLTGVFTSPWYLPTTPLVSAYDTQLCRASVTCVNQTIDSWKQEFRDMDLAGIQFLAPYSWGTPFPTGPWADPANFLPNMVAAIAQGNANVKIAYFQDTNGVGIRAHADPPHCGLDLLNEVAVKKHMYDDDIKVFFDILKNAANAGQGDRRFLYAGRPLLFFYSSYPVMRNREYLGVLLARIREWFTNDFGVNPILIVEKDWTTSVTTGVANSCDPENPPPSPMSSAAIDLVRQNSDAIYSWEFVGTPGQKGVISVGPRLKGFPGGGVVTTHPLYGTSVGTAGVGYSQGPRVRDRRNGLTLTEDWNAIRNANLRMIMAWWDYDEASGISRDNQTHYKYIDLVKQLISPTAPSLNSFGVPGTPAPGHLQSSVSGTLVVAGAAFLPGAVVEFAPVSAPTLVTTIAASYISPATLHIGYGGGAPVGDYYVRVRNSDNTVSQVLIAKVVP